ncbi:hypothetical protein GCM10010990_03880 [Croceicoccus mobilis]|uniref:DUF4112 domain-containing protein n=2 Tax=Croceicoccus mobilis TaxID=1703339 RepID=A0A916YS03_9SPHN|nr:hypothetical protein GCM10010990_03880 [Croceicoccus mobilis]
MMDEDRMREQARFDSQMVGLGTDPRSIRQRVEMLEQVLERSFRIPGINYAVGLDAVAGLIPVLGDIMTAAMGAYIVWEARNLGLPKWQLWRMGANVAVDTAIGAVPVVGDAFDLLFRSNTKNLRIIRKHLDKHHPETRVIDQ